MRWRRRRLGKSQTAWDEEASCSCAATEDRQSTCGTYVLIRFEHDMIMFSVPDRLPLPRDYLACACDVFDVSLVGDNNVITQAVYALSGWLWTKLFPC
jgi:hypothetical protein